MNMQSINRNFLFLKAYKSKLSYVSPFLVSYVMPRKNGGVRLGITTSKKMGGAVERNRARRLVRAAVQQITKEYSGNFDLVVVCRRAILTKKSTEVQQTLLSHLQQANVLS